jgi:hypothetical protein
MKANPLSVSIRIRVDFPQGEVPIIQRRISRPMKTDKDKHRDIPLEDIVAAVIFILVGSLVKFLIIRWIF